MDFKILGPFEVLDDGRAVELGAAKHRALLAVLLLNADTVVSKDRLIEALWGDRAPETAKKALQVYISQLRKALGSERIITKTPGYEARVGNGELDLDRFRLLASEGRNDEALHLWRGTPLADFAYEPFAQAEIARLEELRLTCLEERIDTDLRNGRHASLVGELEALVVEHPLREHLRAQLMLALYRSGRQAEALEAYQTGRRLLADELGLEPGDDLREMQRAILVQDPELRLAVRADAREAVPSGRKRGARTGRFLLAAAAAFVIAAIAASAILVGRSEGAPSVPSNSVAAIDPRVNRVVSSTPVGDQPTRVLATATGVWALNQGGRTVSLIDPGTREIVRTFGIGDSPSDLAVDGHGLWVGFPDGQVSLIGADTPSVVRQLRVRVRPKVRPNDSSIVGQLVSGFGSLWVASGGQTLTRINPATGMIEATVRGVPTGFGNEGGIAVGRGSLWTADIENVAEVDPASNAARVVSLAGSVWHIGGVVAVGRSLWLSDIGNDRVWQLEGATPTVIRSIPVGLNPEGLAYGDGSLWVANSGDGTVMRVDPTTGKTIATIQVGGAPIDLAVGKNVVWVTVD